MPAIRVSILRSFLALCCTCLLAVACGKEEPAGAPETVPAAQEVPATPSSEPAESTVDLPDSGVAAVALAKWTGDLDGMIERRLIRVLTTYSKTSFFIDQGTQRGLVPDGFKLFEDDLNKRLSRLESEHPESPKIESLKSTALGLSREIDDIRCAEATEALSELLRK